MVDIDRVVALVTEVRGRPPRCFRQACVVVEEMTSGITTYPSELGQVSDAFRDGLATAPHYTDFLVWAHATVQGIDEAVWRLQLSDGGAPSPSRADPLDDLPDGLEPWVDRLRLVLGTRAWKEWVA